MSTLETKPRYHHGDLRNALLDAGSAVAHDVGADALSLREVARRAGVSHTAAYNHFADKNDLLRGLAIRAFDELAIELEAATSAGGPPLEEIAVTYLRFAFAHAAEFRFMFQRSLCMPEGVYDPLEVAQRESQAVLRREIVRLQSSRELRPADPDDVLLTVWSQVHGITTIVLETPVFKSAPPEAAEHLARQGIRALIAGIGSSSA
jgi:AcrR family transcriptional regulator